MKWLVSLLYVSCALANKLVYKTLIAQMMSQKTSSCLHFYIPAYKHQADSHVQK